MLNQSESLKTTQKIENKLVVLTPEIEKKLENMSTDLLSKTVIDYQKYKYDISVRNKAEEILNKRGFVIEKEIIPQPDPIKSSTLFFYIFLGASYVGLYIYFQDHPSYFLSYLSYILVGVIWLFRYYYINNKK
ncbi:hypothetical protein [Flavobacterium sp.]|uniref:hypothetical protein n=1 Tax=Flavobacterium sp. TaxID=239 RepID=UPI00286D7B90|nr:hypothetical protein [Flavobacterium sp.]